MGSKSELFFEMANRVFALYRNQMSGNPVKIGDGCATVTGYKLPQPLEPPNREGGSEVMPQVRISVWLCSSRSRGWDQLLRQEKDEASQRRVCGLDSLNAFILRFAGV
jgi:hypothetical protein